MMFKVAGGSGSNKLRSPNYSEDWWHYLHSNSELNSFSVERVDCHVHKTRARGWPRPSECREATPCPEREVGVRSEATFLWGGN